MNEYILEFPMLQYCFRAENDCDAEYHIEEKYTKEELVGAVLRRVTEIKDY